MSVPGSDLDLRLVGYFTVVAREANFGRAAAVLHVAQPSLSRQIQRLEEHLGVRLFDRTPRGSRLTPAGRAFLPRAEALLTAARSAAAAARDAAGPAELTVGYVGDLVVTEAVRGLRRRHPAARIRTRHVGLLDARALTDRRVDALVTRAPLPYPADRLHLADLWAEPRVLVVEQGHRLAGKESVRVGDLAGEPFPLCPSAVPPWNSFDRLEPRPDGAPVLDAPSDYESFEDKLDMVAEGRAVLVLGRSDRRPALRPGLTTVPIEDAAPSRVVLVTRASDANPLIADFHALLR
ncbi:putative transcriptional regulator, LysR family protein [Paractinoplanes abujensis]|uniref:DNA-binding transcriptional LysR family regulator n=1 Tax=Paractinoplanes abujensis TaxID=882441 RepID=A0A7W7CQF7_9ACTN|nr:LysR family transcriptional regulator [Actinoplanes abujensis]MBB4692835.1 DNA-binding transcriptional LysR family regulator [Actinoplanes abujensis]GID22666.1 putative transcriptional regulator, LysR family protein [Actinoplanes abujensis]